MISDEHTVYIRPAHYNDPQDIDRVLTLLNAYANDPMGGGTSLSDQVKKRVAADLPSFPGAFSLIAFYNGDAVGIANCFTGYSTFKGAPLINIHDIAVLPEMRGKGIGEALLKAVESEARNRGCCKLTLEVRHDNPAERLYRRLGFDDGDYAMAFLTKEIKSD